MYLLYLTLKTPNGIFAVGILIYTLLLAVMYPLLRKREKKILPVVLCIVPLLATLIHFGIYGTITFDIFIFLYLESLLPLLLLLPGKSGKLTAAKSVTAGVSALGLCLVFLINAISSPMVHNFTRYSYTESFNKMLDTLKKEYCLSSWKQIDFDALRAEFLPKVQEAEEAGDEAAYGAVITEVAYRCYDSHVCAQISGETNMRVNAMLARNDYGLSMLELDDGSVIAVFVEPDAEEELCISDNGSKLYQLGIHDGTQILAWDGQEIHEAIRQIECVYPNLQFPVKSNEDCFRPMFLAGKGGDSVQVTFLNDDGNEQTVELPKIDSYENRLNWVTGLYSNQMRKGQHHAAYMLNETCGYLQVRRENFDEIGDKAAAVRKGYYPKLTEYYAGLLDDLKQQGMTSLIIDIRNNGGGDDACAGALASLFTDEKRYLVGFGYADETGFHSKEDLYIFPDGRYKDLPVVVLVNSECMSAGDGLAKYLSDCDNVTLMGLTASSGVNQNNGGCIYLTDNIRLLYPVFLSLSDEQVPLIDTDYSRENRIPLDVAIPLTRERALKMFDYEAAVLYQIGQLEELADVELDYAVEYLAQHSSN